MLDPNKNRRILLQQIPINPREIKRTSVGRYEFIFPHSIEFTAGVAVITGVPPGWSDKITATGVLRESDKDALDIECVQIEVRDLRTNKFTDGPFSAKRPPPLVLVPQAIVVREFGGQA